MSRRRLLVAFLAGAAMVPAYAPLEWFPLALAALALLIHLWLTAPGPRAAAWTGFAFGMGMFLVGVSWVYISLHRFGAMPAPLAAFATFAFSVILASYLALAGAVQATLRVPPAGPSASSRSRSGRRQATASRKRVVPPSPAVTRAS